MTRMADEVSLTLAEAQMDARQASDFSNVVTQEIQAANTYLSDQDVKWDLEFRRLGWEATGCTATSARVLTRSPSRSSAPWRSTRRWQG